MNDAGLPPPGQDSLERQIEQLREAVRARDEFVAIAAHELRNPMTPILMQIDVLKRMMRNPSRYQHATVAQRVELLDSAIRQFVRRATNLLDVSRINTGNLKLSPARMDVSAAVSEAVARLAPFARLARCTINAQVQPGIVACLDPLAVDQVIENLLSNALKFGAGMPVDVTLALLHDSAVLTIVDRGSGISPEDQKRVFERFERAIGTREVGGFGIGLWLANQLVSAMGGKITVDSSPGQGSTFIVTLPHNAQDRSA